MRRLWLWVIASLLLPLAAAETVIRINSGGSAIAPDWTADQFFSGGAPYQGAPIPGAPAVYSSVRYGNFAYHLPAPPGEYTLVLKFLEVSGLKAGERKQDVTVNGALLLDDFDIQAGQTAPVAVDRSFPLSVRTFDGVRIQFQTVLRNAMVSAIELAGVAAPAFAARAELWRLAQPLASFTTQHPRAPGTLIEVYRNGLLQAHQSDYLLIDPVREIVFRPDSTPLAGDVITLRYWAAAPAPAGEEWISPPATAYLYPASDRDKYSIVARSLERSSPFRGRGQRGRSSDGSDLGMDTLALIASLDGVREGRPSRYILVRGRLFRRFP